MRISHCIAQLEMFFQATQETVYETAARLLFMAVRYHFHLVLISWSWSNIDWNSESLIFVWEFYLRWTKNLASFAALPFRDQVSTNPVSLSLSSLHQANIFTLTYTSYSWNFTTLAQIVCTNSNFGFCPPKKCKIQSYGISLDGLQ